MSGHLDWEQIGGRALHAPEQAHLLECAACRGEMARLHALRAATRSTIPVDLAARVQLATAAELARRPHVASWQRAALIATALAVVTSLPALLMPLRGDWDYLSAGELVSTVGLLAVAFALASVFAFRPGLDVNLTAPLALTVVSAMALLFIPNGHTSDAPGLHAGCFGAVVLSSAAPLAGLLAILRGQELGMRRGLLAALAAGALGEAMVFRHCELGTLEHLLGAHLAGWVVLLALGAWLGEKARLPLWPARRST